MIEILLRVVFGLLLLIVLSGAGVYAYLQLPKFGASPKDERPGCVLLSPNYRDGEFKNLDPTPPLPDNLALAIVRSWTRRMFAEKEQRRPDIPIPSIKTDLKTLDRNTDLVIWFGHSSCFVQSGGKRFLVDPVFSNHASPVPFVNRAFDGTKIYTPDEMPDIDYLLITHEHWDHLDYPSVMGIRGKVGAIVVPLGVGAHFERWGFAEDKIHKLDWGDYVPVDDKTTLYALPALHYSSRSFGRNQTLWAAYAIIGPEQKLYFSGDSGYGSHLKAAGERFDGFDVAFLDFGQYNEAWRWVHMMPEEIALAASDLKTKAVFPKHMGKFTQAPHSWDDPFIGTVKASEGQPYALIMPIPGEIILLNEPKQYISGWWNR